MKKIFLEFNVFGALNILAGNCEVRSLFKFILLFSGSVFVNFLIHAAYYAPCTVLIMHRAKEIVPSLSQEGLAETVSSGKRKMEEPDYD